ncbi:hypothetical protein [Neorhizobium petrolearium]|uniref:hypothetical protein n=1 Tax=Neorhizobium petrolearium TaxID=515361 RepID=UPI003F823EDA
MRYLHDETDTVAVESMVAFVAAHGLSVSKCDLHGRSAETADSAEIGKLIEVSKTAWGDLFPYYLSISSGEGKSRPLAYAAEWIEAYGSSTDFLLVNYQDGGLISVSGVLLPFQERARKADWWKPPRRCG